MRRAGTSLCNFRHFICSSLFFFNDTATTEIYTLSLHDALPISFRVTKVPSGPVVGEETAAIAGGRFTEKDTSAVAEPDRKSTRLNSSHVEISYAVFCLKKKKLYMLTRLT